METKLEYFHYLKIRQSQASVTALAASSRSSTGPLAFKEDYLALSKQPQVISRLETPLLAYLQLPHEPQVADGPELLTKFNYLAKSQESQVSEWVHATL